MLCICYGTAARQYARCVTGWASRSAGSNRQAGKWRLCLPHFLYTPPLQLGADRTCHSTIFSTCAEVIHMLKEGGAPVKEPTEPVSVMGLGFPPRFKGQPMTKDQRRVLYTTYSCYEAAARLGHEDAFAALIDVRGRVALVAAPACSSCGQQAHSPFPLRMPCRLAWSLSTGGFWRACTATRSSRTHCRCCGV